MSTKTFLSKVSRLQVLVVGLPNVEKLPSFHNVKILLIFVAVLDHFHQVVWMVTNPCFCANCEGLKIGELGMWLRLKK